MINLRDGLFAAGGAIIALVAARIVKKLAGQNGGEPEDRPPVVVSNGSSVTIEAQDEEPTDEWNCHKGNKWSDKGSLDQDAANLRLYKHNHAGKAPGFLLIRVTGTTNQLDDDYIIKDKKAVKIETTHREFKIGIDDVDKVLSITFAKGEPDAAASEKHRLVLSDVKGKKEKLQQATIPLKKDKIEPEFGDDGRIEVRSRWK